MRPAIRRAVITRSSDHREAIVKVQIWHDEMERFERTGRLDEGPCWCADCINPALTFDDDDADPTPKEA